MIDLLARLRLDDMMTSGLKKAALGATNLTSKLLGAGVAVAGLGATFSAAAIATNSVKKAMDFESELSTIQALTGATAAEMTNMQDLALKMGANTKYSAFEAAQGIEELLKAGITPAKVQSGALEAALNLATAGELNLADAAAIMSTSLNAFSNDGLAAARAADILAGTANASATGVSEIKTGLAQVSAVAAGLGLTLEDTSIAIGLFANKGIEGSDAGTSLKTMLQNLQPTTKDQIKLFKALGLMTSKGSNAFYDAKGNIKEMRDIAGLLHNRLAKLTNQQRSLALETLFGTDAVRAANILYEKGAEGVDSFRKEMSKVTALDVAQKKLNNAAGAVEQFRSAIDTLQISALMPTLPILKKLANAAADYVTKYTPQITAGMENAVNKAKAYIKENFINNPEFSQLPTVKQKIEFIFGKLMDSFNAWYESGGRQAIIDATSRVINVMASAVEVSGPILAKIGIDIGSKIAAGIAEGIGNSVMDAVKNPKNITKLNDVASVVQKANSFSPAQLPATIAKKGFSAVKSFVFGGGNSEVDGSNASGLDRVPYNGYVSRLHRDEAVLTKTEASDWRAEQSGKKAAPNVTVNVQSMTVRKDSDIDAIARQIIAYAGY
ncbi:phage tail tape measure protein [Cohnella sp. GCM10020058]|uniref:phage tail tape measure protein n=1 Tax=Cohnella sp. GCM10020058 TaxID=3317330 RepID=UPI003625F83C